MATWRSIITDAMENYDEVWEDVEYCTLSEEELDVKFDNGYGGTRGAPFTLWTN